MFLTGNSSTDKIFAPVTNLLMSVIMTVISDGPDNFDDERRVYFILEEFTSLGHIAQLKDFLKLSSSKNICVIIAYQDFQEIERIYGEKEARSIINNISTLICLGINEPDAARYLSSALGKITYTEKIQNENVSMNENKEGFSINTVEQEKTKLLVSETDLMNLPALQAYANINGIDGVIKIEFDWEESEKINERFILNTDMESPLKELERKKEQEKNNTADSITGELQDQVNSAMNMKDGDIQLENKKTEARDERFVFKKSQDQDEDFNTMKERG